MPEIIPGPRPFVSDKPNSHIIIALHSIPDQGTTGGIGPSFIADYLSQKFGPHTQKPLKSGEIFRSLFKQTLKTPTDYSDSSFNAYRRSLGTKTPEELRHIDITTDRHMVEKANEIAANKPIAIVDSKLFSWLQFLKTNQLLDTFPAVTTATLVSIGVYANENTCINRIINRESENGISLTKSQAKKHRHDRFQTDFHNINNVLYPEGKNTQLAYNEGILRSISHLLIDNSTQSNQKEMDQFFTNTVNILSEMIPHFASIVFASSEN